MRVVKKFGKMGQEESLMIPRELQTLLPYRRDIVHALDGRHVGMLTDENTLKKKHEASYSYHVNPGSFIHFVHNALLELLHVRQLPRLK